jgi:hypothetical protein
LFSGYWHYNSWGMKFTANPQSSARVLNKWSCMSTQAGATVFNVWMTFWWWPDDGCGDWLALLN